MNMPYSIFPNITPDDECSEVKECDYKGEHYSVRDNGAIMRHSKGRKRPLDEKWTFGEKDKTTGYMLFSSARVHIIVATAFYGEKDSKIYVVDHKDTNRCNNRAENLRWLTRLENALNNPATRKRIEYLCGGDIQKFINNPSCLQDLTGSNNDIMWMRTVSREEARNAYANIMSWAEKPSGDTPSNGGMLGEWIYKQQKPSWQPDFSKKDSPNIPSKSRHSVDKTMTVEDLRLNDGSPLSSYGKRWVLEYNNPKIQSNEHIAEKNESEPEPLATNNPLAVQFGWSPFTHPDFPCCPKEVGDDPLLEYANNLSEGAEFVVASYGASTIFEYTIHEEKLLVITLTHNGIKDFALTEISWNGNAFVHQSLGTFFEENGVRAAYTRAQGKEWDGPDSIDDYC